MRPTSWLLTLLLVCVSGKAQTLDLIPVISDLDRPVEVAHAGDGSGRLFILEQEGRIVVLQNNRVSDIFLDIRERVGCCGERGLLGIAFHPDFEANGLFYLNYTDSIFNTVIARYNVTDQSSIADPDSEDILLTITQPFANHNGGQLLFGPDDYLYIGTGDGGSGGDPFNNAQNPGSLLGKILRIDVDTGSPYGIPSDNPFIGDSLAHHEIWALGLRNPFRFSFDRMTGDLFIADVGQDAIEELNLHRAGSPAGENFGWRLMEGTRCFDPPSNCNDDTLALPILEYPHSNGRCSIIGGFRYRGTHVDTLSGKYVFGDFCSGEIFSASPDASGTWSQQVLLDHGLSLSTFGEDEAGELYVADLEGTLYRLARPVSLSPSSGVYLSSQTIDLSVILQRTGVTVSSIRAEIDGEDVSSIFLECANEGSLAAGGLSFRCPAIPLSVLTPGNHVFRVDLELSDGTTESDSVEWHILETME
ncbi:MAG: PQQ-dependent sugar dehydrogenase [Pseudohongiellaceae bacterium]